MPLPKAEPFQQLYINTERQSGRGGQTAPTDPDDADRHPVHFDHAPR